MVRCYLSGNVVHDRVMRAFYEGCTENKDLVRLEQYEPSDVAVVFGVFKVFIPQSYARGRVISQQRQKNLDVIVLETGYVNRGDGENHHYAAGFNGLNGRADFRNDGMPDDRASLLHVDLKPQTGGDYVLLCGQVPWDASVDQSNHPEWLRQTARIIRGRTERPVVFRPHPLAKIDPLDGCRYSTGTPIRDDIAGAHAVVTFNSNSGVDALIAGKVAFAFDEGSMVWNHCFNNLELIDKTLEIPGSRQQWLADLAYAQWTPQEMAEGKAWRHLFR